MKQNRVILEVDNYLLEKIESLASKNCMQTENFCEHVIDIFCDNKYHLNFQLDNDKIINNVSKKNHELIQKLDLFFLEEMQEVKYLPHLARHYGRNKIVFYPKHNVEEVLQHYNAKSEYEIELENLFHFIILYFESLNYEYNSEEKLLIGKMNLLMMYLETLDQYGVLEEEKRKFFAAIRRRKSLME